MEDERVSGDVQEQSPVDGGSDPAASGQAGADGSQDPAVVSDVAQQLVVLQDDQFSYIHDSLAVANSLGALNLVLCGALLGALLVRYFVDGWR